jgi:hypothetical protein
MLRKYSVSMIALLVAASLIGTSDVYQYQYVEGQGSPAPQQQQQKQSQQPAQKATYVTGTVIHVVNYASSDGKACMAMVQLPINRPNNLNLEPGESIVVLAPNESFCTLFGQSKISKTQIVAFIAQKITVSSLPRAIQADPTVIWETFDIYRITRVDM